jgi:hypothetical protein
VRVHIRRITPIMRAAKSLDMADVSDNTHLGSVSAPGGGEDV